jgi:hypothetical protein
MISVTNSGWGPRLTSESCSLSQSVNAALSFYEVRWPSDKSASVNRRATGLYVSYRPGEWQTCDIRLIGRDVTIALNGKTLIDRKEVVGLTAIASDPNEAEPGIGIVRVPQVHIHAAREGWRKSANNALSLSLMGLSL